MGLSVLCSDGWVTPRSYTAGVSLVESAKAPRHRQVHFATPCVEATSKPMQRRLGAAIDTDLLSFYTTLQATLISCAIYYTDVPWPSEVKPA